MKTHDALTLLRHYDEPRNYGHPVGVIDWCVYWNADVMEYVCMKSDGEKSIWTANGVSYWTEDDDEWVIVDKPQFETVTQARGRLDARPKRATKSGKRK